MAVKNITVTNRIWKAVFSAAETEPHQVTVNLPQRVKVAFVGQQGPPGVQGATGLRGDRGEPGQVGADLTYIHDQIVASGTWTVNHNLNKYPSVMIVDSAGSIVTGDVNYLSANSLTVTFSAAFGGKAYIN